MVIFHSYVKLREGTMRNNVSKKLGKTHGKSLGKSLENHRNGGSSTSKRLRFYEAMGQILSNPSKHGLSFDKSEE